MCYFPKKNHMTWSKAYQKGITEFECGCCPECLAKRSNYWALRCMAESKNARSVFMITLTYDNYCYDSYGNIIGERLPEVLEVDKKDCQSFMKRLRRYMEYHYDIKDIKYMLSAEYGKRTHRAHYHLILFNARFDDIIKYKKSKRGNTIYKSATLTKLWKNGICTIDSINCTPAVAKYCTKYCAKDSRNADDTFMLFSHHLGEKYLLDNFNGQSYLFEGQEYAIPKTIWNILLAKKYTVRDFTKDIRYYKIGCFLYPQNKWYAWRLAVLTRLQVLSLTFPTYKYIRPTKLFMEYQPCYNIDFNLDFSSVDISNIYSYFYQKYNDNDFRNRKEIQRQRREIFALIKEKDDDFNAYLSFWKSKQEKNERRKLPVLERLALLSQDKYFAYKQACYNYLSLKGKKACRIPPRSSKVRIKNVENGIPPETTPYFDWLFSKKHLPAPPCLLKANDTKITFTDLGFLTKREKRILFPCEQLTFSEKTVDG